MRKVIGLLALLLFVAYAADQKPLAVESILKEIEGNRNLVQSQRERAKKTSMTVYACIDRKAQIIDRLATIAKRTANDAYKKSFDKGDSEGIAKYGERITLAQDSVRKVVPLVMLCWCEDVQALNQEIASLSSEAAAPLAQACQSANEFRDTRVTLKLSDTESAEAESPDTDNTHIDENYGFPEIPAGSPFR